MIDPLAPETLRLVGNRTRLTTARRIADDIAANGPATYAQLARRTGTPVTRARPAPRSTTP